MSNLEKLGKRLDNILKYIKNEKPKDIWIINNLDILFKETIETNTSIEKENILIKKINELLDQYELRFGETFENLTERLSTRELELKNQLYSQYKSNKKEFVKNYKDKAEQVMTGRAIKTAKSMASKEQKKRISEMIKASLANGPAEEINSMEYVQNRNPIDNEKNPMDAVRMDIPLLLRVMKFDKEDIVSNTNKCGCTDKCGCTNEENQINELVKKVMTKLKA